MACGLSGERTWLTHIYFFEYIYWSLSFGIWIQCDVTEHMYFWFIVPCCISSKFKVWCYTCIHRLWKKYLYSKGITSNFLRCKWPTKANTQLWNRKVDASPRGGELLWSNNRTPNRNLARATKKTTARNRQQREHYFAQRKRSRQQETEERLLTCTDACDCGIFLCHCIQFNSILFECRDKIQQLQFEQSRWREGTADALKKYRQYTMDSQRKRLGEVENCWKFAVEIQFMFFDVICKIHVSDIFPTDWAENSRSAITPWATTGSEWSEMIKFHCKLTSVTCTL